MNRSYKLLTVNLIVTLSFAGCSIESWHTSDVFTDTVPIVENDNFVNTDHIRSFIDRHRTFTKSGKTDYTIDAILSDAGDTLMYIVNYDNSAGGWQVLSADMRTPPIIAEGYTGSFSLESNNGGLEVWMDCVKKDMAAIRNATDQELCFSTEEIEANRATWKETICPARALDDPIIPVTGWWAVRTTSEVFVSDTLDHMTPHWDQDAPYNAYCPLKSNSSSERAPAGCVAIAGAGVLLYLHDKLGVPTNMVSSGYCVGDVDNYSRQFYNATSSAWSSMSYEYHDDSANAEALMIGHVGDLVGMNYHNGYSWALPAHLRSQLFSFYGITSYGAGYDEDIVKSNLENELPVIVTASNLLIPADFNIHCFVIDGYKKTYTKYTHYHYWYVEDGGIDLNPGEHMPYYTYTYTTPEITAIKINWGWGSQWSEEDPLNDGWYSLTANWYVQNGSYYSYNYNVSMSYGFSI